MDSTQVLINSLMSANSVDELKSRLVPLLTAISASGPSGGISDIESTTLDVTIDGGVATVDLPYREVSFRYTSENGTDNGTAVEIYRSGEFGTLTVTRTGNNVIIESDQTPFTLGKVEVITNFISDDGSLGLFVNKSFNTSNLTLRVVGSDDAPYENVLGDPSNATTFYCTFTIRVFP